MKCNKCGCVIPEDSELCQFCGSRIDLQAEAITESQRYFDSDYGYSPDNPIVTSSVHTMWYYLYALRTEDGRNFTWEQQPYRNASMIYEYQLFVDGEPYKTLFFNPHGKDGEYVPAGFVKNQDAFAAAQQGIKLELYQANLERDAKRKKKRSLQIALISLALILISLLFYFIK